MTKATALKSGDILPFPGPTKTAVGGTQNKKSPEYEKAHTAFHNAKGRCNNPNNKDYESYGGSGIKFLLASVDQLIDAIGLPPTKKHSLDRIDPKGHYEQSNIRWALKSVQANNKKHTIGAAKPSLAELTAKLQKEEAAPKTRKAVTVAWEAVLKALARGYFIEDDVSLLRSTGIPWHDLNAGFEITQDRDWAEVPSYFWLPSLSWPGKTIRLRGGPFRGSKPFELNTGTAPYLGTPQYAFGLPEQLVDWIREDVKKASAGAAWVGQIAPSHLKSGGVEGAMLAAASRLRHSTAPRDAVFMPMLKLLRLLDLTKEHEWLDIPELRARFMFVPDLQIDVGEGFDVNGKEAFRMAAFLRLREANGLTSFVGVQNPHKLHSALANVVIGRLNVRDLDDVNWPSSSDSQLTKSSGPAFDKKAGQLNLAELREALAKADGK